MDNQENRTDYNHLSAILKNSFIKATDKYKTPPQIIWVDQSAIATLGNFSASIGKAKAKKTFNVSAIVAASLANKTILNYRAELPEGKQRILYVDTEQSRFHCHNVLERILKLAGLPADCDSDKLDFLCLREHTPSLRMELIDFALQENDGYGLVIIDGIRDLLLDINSASESVEVINNMMKWSSLYNLHIHCVLHQNKSDSNSRGHIGTEMNNKAETVLVIAKNQDNPNVSEVSAVHIREKEFAPFAFTIDDEGLPISCERPSSSGVGCKAPKRTLTNVPFSKHKEILKEVFADGDIASFGEVISAMKKTYDSVGLARGRTTMVNFLKRLTKENVVVRDENGYHLNEAAECTISQLEESE